MSKWKCGICNSEFDNFQAQGFGKTIYCLLCYFKELYRRTKLEIERLNNIINELEKYINKLMGQTRIAIVFNKCINDIYKTKKYERDNDLFEMILDKLKKLKDSD